MVTCFVVPGKLHGKGRPRFSRKTGTVYTPKTTADYEKLVRDMFVAAGGKRTTAPVAVRVDVFHGVPKSLSKKKRLEMLESDELPMKKPDVDNILKIVLDALNGVAYEDDVQVVQTICTKVGYREEPCIAVRISSMEG